MPTLEEILNQDMGLAEEQPKQEKTASAAGSDEITKLAAEIGLMESPSDTDSTSQATKEASMSSLYDELFPEDADLSKTASSQEVESDDQEKVAAEKEAAIGARTYDLFQERVAARIEKLASQSVAESHTAPQRFPTNEHKSKAPIDTTPQIQDEELHVENGPEVVGKEEHRSIKAAAVQKMLLVAQIDEE